MCFPFAALGGKRIPDFGSRMGCRSRIGPQAETVSRISSSNRDALSRRGLWRKLHPGIDVQNGMPFPVEAWGGNRVPEFG